MTQQEIIIQYCKEFGSIIPAKKGGSEYRGHWIGSQVDKRCRELYNPRDPGNPYGKQILDRVREGKFTKYFLKGPSLRAKSEEKLNQDLTEIRDRIASDIKNLWQNSGKLKEINDALKRENTYYKRAIIEKYNNYD